MADRLKDIWSGFEQTTSRNLSGKGVDNIIVPSRADYGADDSAFLPENYSGPAEAAFSALRADLEAKGKFFNRKKKSAQSTDAAQPHEDASSFHERDFSGDELVRGLRSTAMRTSRCELDYESYLSSDAGKAAAKKHKKKRFGIF
ncbi:MAG: hypothetical protein DHS20C05_19360 [Hyphococcus sp.]|nr:MAG: hypothetical protein DHS20C05_19360 [Marinicaulis sp.]